MGAVIKRRQIANQPNPANRPPAHIFDQAVIHFGFRSDHHGAAGELAVTESKKQARTAVQFAFPIDSQGERPARKRARQIKMDD